jgi:quinohemoprotein ethanol dehydrogenase
MSKIVRLSALVSAALLVAACGPATDTPAPAASTAPAASQPAAAPYAAAVNTARLVAADSEPGNWMSNGRDYGEQRFSPLDQITTENVSQLGLAWSADIDTSRAQEATPIVVNGKI